MKSQVNSKTYSNRNKELAAIHIAKKELYGSDDDLYRTVMLRVTGKDSAKDLNDKERKVLLDEFRRLGFKGNKKNPTAKVYTKATVAQSRKIAALWRQLQNLGALEDPEAQAINFFKRCKVTQVDNINWMSTKEAQNGIEMLKRWVDRVQIKKAREES